MTTAVLVPHLLAGAMIAATVDDGHLPGRRILVTINDAAIPEITSDIADHPGFASLASRFDAVVSLNEAIAPLHPRGWAADGPPARSARARIAQLAVETVDRVVVPSLDHLPSAAFTQMFPQARVDVVADRLATYGPAPAHVNRDISARVERVFYADLVPGTTPRMFGNVGATPVPVATESLRRAIGAMAGSPAAEDLEEAWILGERLADLGILTPAQQDALQLAMIEAAAEAGYSAVAFKPHPNSRPGYHGALAERAARLSIRFRVLTDPEPAEVMFERTRPGAVLGSSSTALAIASAVYGIPAFSVGTADVARAMTREDEPQRVALALTRVMLPTFDNGEHPPLDVEAQSLLDVLCHDMQPRRYRRPDSAALEAVRACDGAQQLVDAPAGAHPRREPAAVRAEGVFGRIGASSPRRRYRSVRNVLAALWFSVRL
ncbi:polysialyltransferase family glycosyltransferase [Demequina sp. SO4-13]|uniref:polysialyltransferase family glycosyltransferase n=1 Tax=Demequina sp. SO4-13 TaxID=3401027 RepID=UPI003AF509A2